MRSSSKALLGGVISALLIWWTLRDVSLSEVWSVLRTGNVWLLAASIFVATAGFLLRAFRWRVLLQPIAPDTSLDSRFGAVTIGFMANNLLPARVGEFVRAYALSRVEPVSMSGALGTLVVERVLDGVVLLLFLLLPPLLSSLPPQSEASAALRTVLGGATLGLGVILTVLAVLLLWPAQMVRTAERLLGRLPRRSARRSVDALVAFLDALQVVRRPGPLIQAIVWSLVFWSWHGLSFYLGMAAFGVHEGFLAAMFTEAAVGFGVALPSAPGFFGTFHAAASWALGGVYGVEAARSLAFAYGYHLGGFFPVTFIGLWYARRFGVSLREMGSSERRVERDVEARHPDAAELLGRPSRTPASPRGVGRRATGAPRVHARPAASSAEVEAPAKVNLFLRVLEPEASGYHRIVTLFQSLTLADRVHVELTHRDGIELAVEGAVDPGPPEDNLVRKAADAFLRAAGVRRGVHIGLSKRIPAGGGLGGGSSDAAAALRALDLLLPGALAPGRLAEVGASLGSDVSFFLCGSPLALGEGHGETLTALPPLPAAGVILALPPLSVSTAWAYGALDEHRAASGSAPVTMDGVDLHTLCDWDAVARAGVNDFEEVVLGVHPVIARARDALRVTGPTLVLLSGSGSSVFALYRDSDAAERALERLATDEAGIRFVLAATRTSVPEVDLRASHGSPPDPPDHPSGLNHTRRRE